MAARSNGGGGSNEEPGGIRFRNYAPTDVQLQSQAQDEPAKAPELEQPTVKVHESEQAPSELAKTKANADLKKLAQPKIDVLEARTQKAIASLMHDEQQHGAQ